MDQGESGQGADREMGCLTGRELDQSEQLNDTAVDQAVFLAGVSRAALR